MGTEAIVADRIKQLVDDEQPGAIHCYDRFSANHRLPPREGRLERVFVGDAVEMLG